MVQISNEPKIPIGMSFFGFLASCAAVLTASNPIYAKKTIAAARMIPLKPKSPNFPVLVKKQPYG